MIAWLRDRPILRLKLNRKIEDLEDVRGIMNVLKEVREKESEIDNLIGPIEEMYGLLGRWATCGREDATAEGCETQLVSPPLGL